MVRCIEMGALDHLPKPFEPALLDARIGAALSAKRLRDLEVEYLEQVGRVTRAAEALEADGFEPENSARWSNAPMRSASSPGPSCAWRTRSGAREEALRRQLRELTIEIDETRQARKVAEITESDYFRSLRSRAAELRRTAHGDSEPRSRSDERRSEVQRRLTPRVALD